MLRGIAPDEVPRCFERWQHLLRAVDRTAGPPDAPPLGPDAVDAIGWYVLTVTEVDSLALADVFSRILQRDDISIMSTLERTFQKGIAQGRVEGRVEGVSAGKAMALLRLLASRFGPLDGATTAKVHGATADRLDDWIERVLGADSLHDLLRDDSLPGKG